MKNSNVIADLIEFIDNSPTAWQAADQAAARLLSSGFKELKEGHAWQTEPGKKYFTVRNGSSLCAFIMPKQIPESIALIGSHTDSPGFKLKPNPEFSRFNMTMLGLEVYGSPLLGSWLNRDLGIAGRIAFIDEGGRLQEMNVVLDQRPVIIPQLALHLDRDVNKKGLVLNAQQHTSAIAAIDESGSGSYLEPILRDLVAFKQLLDHDLFVFPLDKARFVGRNEEMISSYRTDNLAGVHASLQGILSAEADDSALKMIVLWDNEEIGSATPQGAESPYVLHVLERLVDRSDLLRLLPQSLCVSIDLAHGVHPNYSDRHDPNHSPLLGEGIVIKYNANQRYATDARSSAMLQKVCADHKIPTQKFVVRSDIPCGSTIGPLHAKVSGMPTVDIGIPQLSMHSARELIASADHINMARLASAIFA